MSLLVERETEAASALSEPVAAGHTFLDCQCIGQEHRARSDLKHLSDLNDASPDPIRVQVSIVTLIEKLYSNNGSHWTLACRINDGLTSLDVDISNGVLTELIGFSAEDSIAMRQRFKSEPKVKEIFAESLSQCQNKLISGRNGCLVELEPASCSQQGKKPRIVKLILQSR
ncbi:recq-mediated genome instability protein 1 [Plakobranchus ocellatus]|uniref:Recq-mediated genome instability protein 1 n=1 Tax=Plakobranchus ocellatus TaxID=259542 RepID=A0AAV4AZA6_9GAST|nr:recq-mediated genome instability protein 1 [Plakobranchus ocellatus]